MIGYKRVILIFLGVLVVFFLFLLWYQYRYSMDFVESYEVNSPNLEQKLLIASQGSEFKNRITNEIIDHYKMDSIYIEVVDVNTLSRIDTDNFSAILVLHTWENWKPPKEVKLFMERTSEQRDKTVVLTTSGEGSYKMDGIDALVGESILENVPVFTKKITEKLDTLLLKNN